MADISTLISTMLREGPHAWWQRKLELLIAGASSTFSAHSD
ncbi:hypothetical protein [Corynebacterium phocae]|nr:hypothetical protein [Corynebacterium phocae]